MGRRSRIFALVGLPVVVVAVVLVALSADPTDPTPKGTYALIFAIIGVFVFALLAVQTIDMRAASEARTQPTLAPGTSIDNPMTLPMVDLWAALALGPIGDEAMKANVATWGLARRSQHTGWIVCAVIFVAVPMTYLTGSFAPVLVGAAVIALIAIVYMVRLGGVGGDGLADAYDAIARSVEPLGLDLVERPKVGLSSHAVPPYGLKSDIRGSLRFAGDRHGRRVEVTVDDGGYEVRIATAGPPAFEAKARDGRVRGKRAGELPPAIEAALSEVPNSTDWKGTSVVGDREGIVVAQKPIPGQGWMPGLWLAERLADASV